MLHTINYVGVHFGNLPEVNSKKRELFCVTREFDL